MRVNELSIPSYMTSLPQDVVDSLTSVDDERVIACGVDPKDNSLVFVTNSAAVLLITPNGGLTPAAALPALDGKLIYLSLHGYEQVFPIDVQAAVKSGRQCAEGDLFVNDRFVCNVSLAQDT